MSTGDGGPGPGSGLGPERGGVADVPPAASSSAAAFNALLTEQQQSALMAAVAAANGNHQQRLLQQQPVTSSAAASTTATPSTPTSSGTFQLSPPTAAIQDLPRPARPGAPVPSLHDLPSTSRPSFETAFQLPTNSAILEAAEAATRNAAASQASQIQRPLVLPSAAAFQDLTAQSLGAERSPTLFQGGSSSLTGGLGTPGTPGTPTSSLLARGTPVKRKHSKVGGNGSLSESGSSSSGPSQTDSTLVVRRRHRNSADLKPRPAAFASFHDVSEYLMQFCISDDTEFSLKALESLHKKMKDRPNELDWFMRAVETDGAEGAGSGQCVLVPRTLDGRLQVAGKKGFPHVIYARMFRYDDTNKAELKALPDLCQNGFDQKEQEPWLAPPPGTSNPAVAALAGQQPGAPQGQVCVNPWHYQRVYVPDYIPITDGSIGSIVNKPKDLADIMRAAQPQQQSQQSASSNQPLSSPLQHQQPQQQQLLTSPLRGPVQHMMQQPAGLQQLSPLQLQQLQAQLSAAPAAAPTSVIAYSTAAASVAAMQQQLQLLQQAPPAAATPSQQQQMQLVQPPLPATAAREMPIQRVAGAAEEAATAEALAAAHEQQAAAAAAQAQLELPSPGMPACEAFQEAWERTMSVQQPSAYNAWKSEEKRLLAIDPPRFMPIMQWEELKVWHAAWMHRLVEGAPVPEGWYDDAITRPVPEEDEQLGYLVWYFPDRRRRLEQARVQRRDNNGEDQENEEDDEDGVPRKKAKKEEEPERSASTPIDVLTIDEASSLSQEAPSSSETSNSSAASHAVAMSYSQQGHFGQQLQLQQQQQPQQQQQQPQQQQQQPQQQQTPPVQPVEQVVQPEQHIDPNLDLEDE